MLVDAPSLYFRAYHGVPESVTAPDGSPVNAVRGFLDMLATLVGRFSPDGLVACLDLDWRPAWRVELLPSYKAHRLSGPEAGAENTPEGLVPQVPVLLDLLAAFGIVTAGAVGYEADDVMGTLATRASGDPVGTVDIVTGDRDLFQLVDDARGVRVLYIGRGVARLEIIDDAAVRQKYGVPASAYADLAVLRGDPSDGLPGVTGIGEKTAALLLTRFGSLAALLAALDDPVAARGAGAQRRRLDEARDYLAVAPRVVRVVTDIPLPDLDPALPPAPADPAALDALTARWGVGSSVRRLQVALGHPVAPADPGTAPRWRPSAGQASEE